MIQIQAGMSTSYQQHLKDQNVTLLFDLVRRRVPISRAELTKTSGLSAAAFTSGDEAVTVCLQSYGRDLCCAVVSLVNLLDVRAVRLGGSPYLLGAPSGWAAPRIFWASRWRSCCAAYSRIIFTS